MEGEKEYTEFQIKIEQMCKKKVIVVPIVEDAFGAIPKYLKKPLNAIGMGRISTHQLQKVALFRIEHMMMRSLAILNL